MRAKAGHGGGAGDREREGADRTHQQIMRNFFSAGAHFLRLPLAVGPATMAAFYNTRDPIRNFEIRVRIRCDKRG